MIAFSADQTSIEIYQYKGPAAAGKLLSHCYVNFVYIFYDQLLNFFFSQNKGGILTDDKEIERNIFDAFFFLKHVVVVAPNREQLNRECSLFTDDGK